MARGQKTRREEWVERERNLMMEEVRRVIVPAALFSLVRNPQMWRNADLAKWEAENYLESVKGMGLDAQAALEAWDERAGDIVARFKLFRKALAEFAAQSKRGRA